MKENTGKKRLRMYTLVRSFVFVFIYFYEDNTMYFARINEKDIDEMVYEEWRNRYCLKKSLFQQVQLRRDYRLLNVL